MRKKGEFKKKSRRGKRKNTSQTFTEKKRTEKKKKKVRIRRHRKTGVFPDDQGKRGRTGCKK